MILVNFKIYKQSFGKKGLELAKMCRKVSQKSKVEIIPIVSALEAVSIKKEVGGKVFLQNVDLKQEGAFSGQISMEQAYQLGIDGTLLNHSEARKAVGTIKQLIKIKPKNFEIVLCVRSAGQVEKWASKLKVNYIAYEPSYLIGNKEKSVASEKPEVIAKIAKMIKVPLLVGAGIKSKEDVEISLKMGAKGILVASSVVKSDNPEKELLELASAFSV